MMCTVKRCCINSNVLHCSMCKLKTCVLKHCLVLYKDKKYMSNCDMPLPHIVLDKARLHT